MTVFQAIENSFWNWDRNGRMLFYNGGVKTPDLPCFDQNALVRTSDGQVFYPSRTMRTPRGWERETKVRQIRHGMVFDGSADPRTD